MAGIRLGGVAVLQNRLPDQVILAYEATTLFYFSLWKIGNLAEPLRFDSTIISSSLDINDYLADPEKSPDNTEVIYCRAGTTSATKKQSIRKVNWDDTNNVELYQETNIQNLSLQPTWKPDGSKILFRAKGAGTPKNLIKHMDPDGTNVATLYTGAALVECPTYSWDGTKIAFGEAGVLKVMNADGTGVSTLRAPPGIYQVHPGVAWMYSANTLAFYEKSGSFSADAYWKKINADGTGAATLVTINRSVGYGPSDSDPYAINWSWLSDDSAFVTTLQTPSDPDPDHHMVYISPAGGSTLVSPARDLPTGTPDFRPAVMWSPLESTWRIYFGDEDGSAQTIVASTLEDGSDYRVDFDGFPPSAGGTQVVFQGFKGDTVNI